MRTIAFALILCAGLAASGCAKLTLAWADLDGDGPQARPPALGERPVDTIEKWERLRAPLLRAAFAREVYGFPPEASQTRILDRRTLNEAAFGGEGRLEEYRLEATATFSGVSAATRNPFARSFGVDGFFMDVLLPANAARPVPVILVESFCPRWDTIPDPALPRPEDFGSCNEMGPMTGAMRYIFGRYVATPPVEMILERGYAVATIYPEEIVPDREEEGLAELRRLSAGHENDETRWGAVAAWGWAFSRMVDVLEKDPRLDKDAMIVWGHSRYGKAALVAAAYDARIDGVIAHQSGTGGAALNRGKKGESLREITQSYPHWFSRAYAGFAGREEEMSVDQHMLLALIAPRPVLLGNARRDVWSDPAGSFRAAEGAAPVYALYGSKGLDQERLVPYKPDADIAFWIRPGTHGVVKEDWPAFLDFLDAHFAHRQMAAN